MRATNLPKNTAWITVKYGIYLIYLGAWILKNDIKSDDEGPQPRLSVFNVGLGRTVLCLTKGGWYG